MAISVVGTAAAAVNNGGNAVVTLPAGTLATDWVIVWSGHFFRAGLPADITNYPLAADAFLIGQDNTANPAYEIHRATGLVAGDTITGVGTGNNADGTAIGVIVLRGADLSTTPTWNWSAFGSADPAQVSVATTGSAVLVLGIGAPTAADTTPGTITNYTVPTMTGTVSAADTNDAHVLCAYRLNVAAGTENPAAWSTLTAAGYVQLTIVVKEAPPPAAISQVGYRFYSDGTESGSTALGTGENTSYSVNATSDVNLQARIELQETGGSGGPASTDDWQLYYEKASASGTWVPVTTSSSVIRAHASANVTDGGATTNRLSSGTGTFAAGKISEDGVVDDLGWAASGHTELVYPITLRSADLVNGDDIRLRVYRNGAATVTPSQDPRLLITKTAPPATAFTGWGIPA